MMERKFTERRLTKEEFVDLICCSMDGEQIGIFEFYQLDHATIKFVYAKFFCGYYSYYALNSSSPASYEEAKDYMVRKWTFDRAEIRNGL